MYAQNKDQAAFFLVYIREAHPDSILFTKEGGAEKLLKIGQTDTVKDRAVVAKQCLETLKLSIPTLLDGEDNKVNAAYAGWPDRLYVVGTDGKIAYQGGPGPKGFRVEEVVEWLDKLRKK
jgi:hypothetical protein